MKKPLALLLPCAALLLSACNDSSYESHQTYFSPQYPMGMRWYADQQSDTLHVLSLDAWTAHTTADWLTVTPTSGTPSANMGLDVKMSIAATVNNTDEVRGASIVVDSYDQVAMPVYQYPWLNISRPAAVAVGADTSLSKDSYVKFIMDLRATAVDTTIIFTVYQDRATLTSSADWVVPDTTGFDAGTHIVPISIAANHSGNERSALLTLTSAGVSTHITLNQTDK